METLFLLGPLVALALCERLPSLRFEPSAFLRRRFGTDVVYFSTSAVGLGLLIQGAVNRLVGGTGTLVPGLSRLPGFVVLLLALVLYDLAAYASHLLLHRSERLWRIHKVHHSSPTLDWLATFRAHFIEHALRHVASSGILLAAGFPLWSVATAGAISAAWAAFVHSNLLLDLHSIELLFITPRLHRLHHVASTGERNLGTFFSFWDRLRGNLLSDPGAALSPLGVPGEIDTYPQAWLPQLIEPLRRRLSKNARTGPFDTAQEGFETAPEKRGLLSPSGH